MQKPYLILLAIIVVAGCNCKSTCCSNTKNQSTKMIGEWIWTKTICCGRNAQVTTPQTEGYRMSMKVINDKELETYKNNELVKKSSYTIYTTEMEGKTTIKIDNANRYALLSLNKDTLVLDYGYMDLQTEYYIRKK